MEIFNSACFVVVLYCTNLFGLKHCVAVPLPTLLNYYDNSPKNNWNLRFRQTKEPIFYHEKFVFPNKEPWPIVSDRINYKHSATREDTGQIFFPDDTISTTSEKAYAFQENEARPILRDQHRPTSALTNSGSSKPLDVDQVRIGSPSADGSQREHSLQLSNSQASQKPEQSDSDTLTFLPAQSSPKATEEERVAAAVREFYEWLKQSKPSRKPRPPTEAPVENDDEHSKITPISDQSLVAGLGERKCKPNQILVNGECKTKVSV